MGDQDFDKAKKEAKSPKHAKYVEAVQHAIKHGGKDEKSRTKAMWDQFKKNGDAMLADGAGIEELIEGVEHAIAHKDALAHAVKVGVEG